MNLFLASNSVSVHLRHLHIPQEQIEWVGIRQRAIARTIGCEHFEDDLAAFMEKAIFTIEIDSFFLVATNGFLGCGSVLRMHAVVK